jgi:hypothetical protein
MSTAFRKKSSQQILDVLESFSSAYAPGMSTKHIRTTGDLMRFDAALKVTCRSCGAARTFNAVDAVMTFGNIPLWHT